MSEPGHALEIEPLADELDAMLADDDARLANAYSGDRGVRQPVHTVYVPADRYDSGMVAAWGERALAVLDGHTQGASELAGTVGADGEVMADLWARVRSKLVREPIEDLRIDLEDGYGTRPDDEEDADAIRAAHELARSRQQGTAPPFHGIRFKSLEAPTRRRGVRTLGLFLSELVEAGGLPDGFVVTLPKVTSVHQVEAMRIASERFEHDLGLPAGRLGFEIQVETPQSILGTDGTAVVARMIQAGRGRVTGLHYGTYDYSASCGIAAAHQSMEHPVADHAKAVMQVAAAGTGVHVSDGSTNVLPVGDSGSVLAAWTLHARLVRRSLERGFYQGWDLHPAQLPTRYLATFAFYRGDLDASCARLRAYVHGGDSGYLDEPATAAALAGFVLRALDCGAVTEAELHGKTALDLPTLTGLARRPVAD